MDEKYLNRITSEHRIRPKFMEWLSANLDKAGGISELYRGLDKAFDIERAGGVQLDMLGQAVGVSRLLDFQPVYAAPLLTDDYFRVALKAKISLNQWDGTIQGVKDLWNSLFNGYALEVVDWQDMSMTLRVINLESLFESEFISHGYLAPKPESVRVNYEFIMTRFLDTRLSIGGVLASQKEQFSLSVPEAAFPFKAGKLFAAGVISNATSRIRLKNPAGTEPGTSGKIYVGGVLSIGQAYRLAKPVQAMVTVLSGVHFWAGRAAITVAFQLQSMERG